MRYSTGPRRRSRLQGHRRRRRAIVVTLPAGERHERLTWTEYKTLRQYHSMGDVLDRMMAYGHDPVEDSAQVVSEGPGLENGHAWLTEEPAM